MTDAAIYVLAVVIVVGIFAFYSRSLPPVIRGFLIGMAVEATLVLLFVGWRVNR